ncbi:hypothetical protein A2625_00280 [candidate division WOR-1 bacterium RIFCSPHIGHO2_01_FULL_53_15]|uniref:CopG family transcriptional regulator n=1 Tax=candidate division WOR-1 bacterium RIFCSPHIGHO2_01_FULL_53_15 TaxID=1802564 RepID=A0A1F4Q0V8_UNCSA|nr:MAG: hypothetical protein A2625_00280 [candidate division WOR-1 bacterium RIFCSPHIGHO2_01_FULL_53_15]OGC10460.1 MAG: hypothetical protein A3D23_03370 [candidate division WOR-1 bacterium RIFCSPHIGHO2_02_FULL_53_26]
MTAVKLLEAKIPKNLYIEIEERVRLGLFLTESEVISSALRKAFAEEAREFLKRSIKSVGVSKKSMLNEWKRIRG